MCKKKYFVFEICLSIFSMHYTICHHLDFGALICLLRNTSPELTRLVVIFMFYEWMKIRREFKKKLVLVLILWNQLVDKFCFMIPKFYKESLRFIIPLFATIIIVKRGRWLYVDNSCLWTNRKPYLVDTRYSNRWSYHQSTVKIVKTNKL